MIQLLSFSLLAVTLAPGADRPPLPTATPVGRIETVATFDGPMPTGVTVSHKGRVFVNATSKAQVVPANGKLVVFHGGGLVSSNGTTNAKLTTRYVTQLRLPPGSAAIVYA